MKKELSPTMIEAIAFIEQNGGRIYRHPGGYWSKENWTGVMADGVWFGTSTIESLVMRGILTYIEWQDGRHGPFPVRAQIIEAMKGESHGK